MNASSTLSRIRLAAGATFLTLSTFAVAQTPAPGTAPAVAGPACESPGDLPKAPKPGMNTMDNFQKKVDAYGKCLKDYVAVQRTKAEASMAEAKAHQDAANEAVGKYNDYVTALNEQAKKANSD